MQSEAIESSKNESKTESKTDGQTNKSRQIFRKYESKKATNMTKILYHYTFKYKQKNYTNFLSLYFFFLSALFFWNVYMRSIVIESWHM